MKTCPICEEVFTSFQDVVEVNNKVYHEECIEIIPIKFCAYIPGDYEDGYLGNFEPDDKTWASNILDEEEYLEEKPYLVTYLTYEDEVDSREQFALSKEDATKIVSQWGFVSEVISVEEVE
ncbi:hypothetical protein [Enterococcus sp. AZ192]|uniref:hypothetical protein n=1 Tax=unclassified Enterococcus TaxID=2608891 RepID=UPI003D2ABB91